MAVSFGTASFGIVALAAVTLYTIGPPGSRNNAEQAAKHPPAVVAATTAPPAPEAKAPQQVAAAGITLRSVEVTLPSSDRLFPGGAPAEAINNNCVACHSAGMVLNQPSLSRADWQGEVNKMRNVYKAPVEDADAAAIVDYLAKTKGL